jgi:hypothetical protein
MLYEMEIYVLFPLGPWKSCSMTWWVQVLFMHDLWESYSMNVNLCTFSPWSLTILLIIRHDEHMHFLWLIFGNHTLWNANVCYFFPWSLGILLYEIESTCTFWPPCSQGILLNDVVSTCTFWLRSTMWGFEGMYFYFLIYDTGVSVAWWSMYFLIHDPRYSFFMIWMHVLSHLIDDPWDSFFMTWLQMYFFIYDPWDSLSLT